MAPVRPGQGRVQEPPPPEQKWLTDTTEDITFPQLRWRAIKQEENIYVATCKLLEVEAEHRNIANTVELKVKIESKSK